MLMPALRRPAECLLLWIPTQQVGVIAFQTMQDTDHRIRLWNQRRERMFVRARIKEADLARVLVDEQEEAAAHAVTRLVDADQRKLRASGAIEPAFDRERSVPIIARLRAVLGEDVLEKLPRELGRLAPVLA